MINFRFLIKRETSLISTIAEKIDRIDNSLLVGSLDFAPLLLGLNTRYHFLCDDHFPHHPSVNMCLAAYHELPFEPDSMDIVLLPHTLEQTDKSRLALEEAVSILAPNGYLIVFNTKKYPMRQLCLSQYPSLTITYSQRFSLPFSYLKQPWENYAEACLPFLCQAYVLVAKKIVHSPLTLTTMFEKKSPAFTLRGEHACSRDIH